VKKFAPITHHERIDPTNAISLTGMIAVDYVLLTYTPAL
jgi:hypothetical protein